MDRLDALKVFCTVVECGGFSRAAERLGISTSSVTNQVGALERHFKVKLLHRTTRSMSLTDEGRLCHADALRILGEMNELELTLRHAGQTPQGSLRVDMPGIISRLYVAPALPRFLREHPGISLRLSARDKWIDMVEEGVDVLVRVGEPPSSNLIGKVLLKTRYVTCAAPAFLAAHGTPQTPEQLAGFPCLHFLYPKSGRLRPWQFRHGRKNHVTTPPGVMASDHVDSLIEAALAGCGMIQVLSVSVREQLRQGTLVAILDDVAAPGPNLYALYPQQHLRAAKVKVFVDFLARLFAA